MCDEADDACDIWQETERVARKAHRCYGCGETIKAGDRYVRTSTLYDGSWSTWKHCARCHVLFDKVVEHAREDAYGLGPVAVDPGFGCGVAWEDPPEDVAALAFAIPGDFATQDRESSDRGAS